MSHINHLSMTKIKRAGFTLIEMIVVVAIVSILAGFLLNRVSFYQEQAEKVAMEQVLGNIRSALHLQLAVLVARNKASDIPRLVKQNPMSWLAEKPSNYVGEYFSVQPGDVVSGSWYFELKDKNLVYLVHNGNNLNVEVGSQKQLRFRVSLLTSARSAQEPDKTADNGSIEGVILEPIAPYTWF